MTEFERGMILSSMSDVSVARTLGWSEARVTRARGAVGFTATPAPSPVQDRAGRAPRRRPVPAPPVVAPAAAEPALPSPTVASPPVASPAPPADLTPSGRPVRRMARAAAPKPLPVRPDVLRWCRWFLAAGWSPSETAGLFDLSDRDLAHALGAAR